MRSISRFTARLNALQGALLVTAVSFVVAGPASAQTFEQTLISAYLNNPSLAASRASVRVTDEGVAQARSAQRPNVTLSAEAGLSTLDGFFDDEFRNNQSMTLSAGQTLYDGGAAIAGIESARAGVEVARAQLSATEQTVLLDAVTAYSDVRRDTQFLALAENNVLVIERELQAARDRFEVGEATRTDVAQAEARLAAARSNLIASEGALARSIDAYSAATSKPVTGLAPPPGLPALPAIEDEAQMIAQQNHPNIRAAREAVFASEFNLRSARTGFSPTVSASVSVSNTRVETPAGSNITPKTSVGLSASVPLYSGGRNVSLLRQRQAQLEQSMANLQDAGRIIRQQVAAAWSQLDVSRASITSSREQITAARVAFEGVQEEATLGARTMLEVLDAEQDLLNAQSNLVSAERDKYVAVYSLLSATGLLSVDQLGLDVKFYDPKENFDAVQRGPFFDGEASPLDRILGRF